MTSNCPTCRQALPPIEDVLVDEVNRELIVDGQHIVLTPSLFACFLVMWKHKPTVLNRERIHHAMFADDIDGGPEPKMMDVLICQLRKRLVGTRVHIETHWGVGYRVVVKDKPADRPKHWRRPVEQVSA